MEECCFVAQSCTTLCNPMDRNLPVPLSMRLPKKNAGMLFPPSGDFPNPGIQPASLGSPALTGRFFATSATWEAPNWRRVQFILVGVLGRLLRQSRT